jgi:hypothetical protein
MVEGYDNTRRLTRQDLIDHFVDLNHGETFIKAQADVLASRPGRRRTIAAIRGDLSRTRVSIAQTRELIDDKLKAMDQQTGTRDWKDELTPPWEDLKHLYDIFENLLVELDKVHQAREERHAERVRTVHRTVNRGNADPYRGAHLKIQNLVHSSPDILSYHPFFRI